MGDVVAEVGAFWTETIAPSWSARDWLFSAYDLVLTVTWQHFGWLKAVDKLAVLLCYGHHHQGITRRRRVPMDVDAMVARWATTLLALSTAHDHAARTKAESDMDELLEPIKAAPVEQLRAFTEQLTAALKADERIPFLVWSTFQQVILPVLRTRPGGKEIVLHQELAQRIAEKAAANLPAGDIVTSIAGALQWRGEESLKDVEKALDKGLQPRIAGKQSCLFLSIQDEQGEEIAEVLL